MRGLSIHGMGGNVWPPVVGAPVPQPLSPAPSRDPSRRRQELGIETTTSPVGNGANQWSDLQSCRSAEFWAASQNSKRDAATVTQAAREASLCLDSPRIHQQSHEGIGQWCCAGLSGVRALDHSPHSAEFGHGNSSHQCGVCRCGPNRSGWRAIQSGAERDEGAGSKQNRYRFVAPRQTVTNECSWSYWRTAGTLACRRLFRRSRPEETLVRQLDILKWSTGDLLEECRFLLNTQLMFLKIEKGPNLEAVR